MRRKPQNGNKSSAATTTWAPKQGRPTQAIIENNRKTELCRNWQKGACTYGGRCAFAHGSKELKYRTLREMENAGRIPDASKYRCYPCMTWVATGSCPYASRCVFIHDLRVKGPVEAWLYAGCLAKSPTACPSSDSFFFFPDITRDPDSTELPTHPAQYDLDSRTPDTGETSSRAVYKLWYSFVSTLVEEEAMNESNTSPASNSTSSSCAKTPNLLPASSLDVIAANKRSKNPASASASAAAETTLTTTKGAATSRRQASKLAQANCKLGAPAADPGLPSGILHQSGSTTTIPTTATTATTTNTTTSAIAASTATGFPQSSRQQHLLREIRRPRGSVKHLPVFEGLSRGASTCPISPLPPMAGDGPPPATLVEGAGGSFWDDSGSEEIMFLDSYDSSCAGSSFSLDTEEISMPPTPRMAMSQSTDSESYTSAPSELRCHIYSCEHLRLLKPGRLPSFSAASLNRDDSWVSDSAGNPSDIGGQVTDDAINVQDSGGGSVVVETPPPTIASVATKSVRSGYAVVHHRQQACAGVGPLGATVDAALRKRGSIHAVPSF